MADPMLLTLNAGSSSLKFALYTRGSPPQRVMTDAIERIAAEPDAHAHALDAALSRLDAYGGLEAVSAVGHRIVYGGARFDAPCVLSPEVTAELRRLAVLDPDHLPAEIAIIEATARRAPQVSQVACFDTAFHRTMPRVARLLPIPYRYEEAGLQRYGFHGLSYTFLIEELARVAGEPAAHARVILAHLGSGSSMAALRGGASVETTMGFTPTSGIPMGTRSGDIDPGVVLYMLRHEGMTADAIDDLFNRRAGLVGVSGTTSDVRDLLAREATDPRAADALALFCHRARQAVGALAATLGGVDTLVFSGGIGANAAAVRQRITSGLEHLGIGLDDARNASGGAVVSADASPCTVRVMRTDEEAIIARQTLRTLSTR